MSTHKIYVYIKTHNKTGLKYFGKTTRDDVSDYPGSGIKWRKHLDEFGYDVNTQILGVFSNIDEAKNFTIKFSQENDIAQSEEWANSIPECINDKENFTYVNELGLNNINNCSEEAKQRHKEGSTKGGLAAKRLKLGIHGFTPEERRLNSQLGVKALQEKLLREYGYKSVFSYLNKDEEFNNKRKESFKRIKHQQKEKNSQYGTCWIKNNLLEMNKRIKKEELELYISLGWEKGRVIGWPSKKE